VKKIVLAYSGGLDTSIILKWLKNEYGCEVIAFSADLGQGTSSTRSVTRHLPPCQQVYIDDLKEEFVRISFIRCSAPMRSTKGTTPRHLHRPPLIAKRQMEIAKIEGADAVSHGATGKGNDQVRFELAYYHFDRPSPSSPMADWKLNSRAALVSYAKKNGILYRSPRSAPGPLIGTCCTSFEGGILEDTWAEPPENMYVLTKAPEKAPNKPQFVEIEFKNGMP